MKRQGSVVLTRLLSGMVAVAAYLAVAPIGIADVSVARAGESSSISRDSFRYKLGPGDSLAMAHTCMKLGPVLKRSATFASACPEAARSS